MYMFESAYPLQVLKMLSVAMGLHILAAVLMLLHLWRYSYNGRGIPTFETLSESEQDTACPSYYSTRL